MLAKPGAGWHRAQFFSTREIIAAKLILIDWFCGTGRFQTAHLQWVEHALANGRGLREDCWSETIAVGSLAFVEKIKGELGIKVVHREVASLGDSYALRERSEAYARQFAVENEALRTENTFPWNESLENSGT